MIIDLEYLSCEERQGEQGVFSLEIKAHQGDLNYLPVPNVTYKRSGEGHFTREGSDRKREKGFKLKKGIFISGIKYHIYIR